MAGVDFGMSPLTAVAGMLASNGAGSAPEWGGMYQLFRVFPHATPGRGSGFGNAGVLRFAYPVPAFGWLDKLPDL